MKLTKIKLNNFRQFYGSQILEVAQDSTCNVTLVHAENGIGKTALLNSVYWCLYGETTKKFEKSDQIINFQAASEGETLASVEVYFDHAGAQYSVQRTFSTKRGNGKPEQSCTAYQIERGTFRLLDASDTFVNSVIPRPMARYYFFDGEHAETFSAETNFKEVGKAIKNMLGSTIAERAIEDLQYAAKHFTGLMGQIPGDAELQEITKEIEALESNLTKAKEQHEALVSQRDALKDQITAIEEKLRAAEGAKELQEQRDDKGRQLRQIQDRLHAAEVATIKWIGTKSLPLIARKLSSETLSFIDEQSLKGRIPSPYNEDFVQGLLKDQTCVCGRSLPPGSSEWVSVHALLKKASNAEILKKVVAARSRVTYLREIRLDAPKVLEAEQHRVATAVQERREVEQKIGELGEKLKGLPLGEIAERERTRQQKVNERESVIQKIGAVEITIQRLERLIKEKQTDQSKVAARSSQARKLVTRRDLAERAAEVLRAYLEQHEEQAREMIAKEVNLILDKTARRLYKFAFKDNFAFDLTYADGRTVPRSSGENQLVSLAFIAALIKFSLSRSKQQNGDLLIPGVVAPLVLDSPFGQLDTKYREDTASFVPAMASQVVLLVSSSQGDEHVLKALRPHVGREYVLISENSGPRGEKSTDPIVLNGKKIQTSIFNCKKNLTRIQEVS
jgi:DNA sulfur modification protein DndD